MEAELLELAGRGAWQRVTQLDRRRALEVRQPAAAVLDEVGPSLERHRSPLMKGPAWLLFAISPRVVRDLILSGVRPDGRGGRATQDFEVVVRGENHAPATETTTGAGRPRSP